MANTKKPEGLTVTRAGLKFTTKWKIRDKDYGDGQQFQYAVFTTQKKYESALNFIRQGFTITSGVTWHNISVRSSSTSATVSLSAGSFFPTAKKPYLAGIIFRVRGNRKAYTEKEKYKDSKGRTKYRDVTVNPGWSAWAYKGFDITAPAAPKASVAWSEDYINRTTFSWDCGNETQGAPYTRCVYQTVTALDYNGKVENIPAWKSAANNNVTSRQSSIYRDEPNLADKNLTRAYRIKAIGPGGESAWRYARHPYGAPEQAVNVTCETTRNEAVGSYHLVIAWTAPNSVANPITKTTAEYLIAEPGGIVETEQGLLPTVPAQAQWTPFPATKDTNGANAFSFDLQETLGDDECLWVHVITTHDNHDTPSEAVLAAKGMLQGPTITNLETDASTHRAEITIQAGTSVPGAFHAIKYEPADGSSDPDAGKIIGIIPNGSTVAQIQCPAWTATPAFGVYAVLGEEESDYTRTDGVTIYTLNEVMTSAVESSGGNVPKAPENVRAAQIGTSDTIQVLWDVVWNEATGAEVSWADHADAWISTEQPQTFDVQNLRESVLNITGLELGKVWFVRVRLYQTNTGGTNVYGPYSDIIPVDLSTIPAVPDLQISDEDGIIPATGSTVASWVYVSEDGTRQKAATLAEVTYEDDEPVYTRLIGLTTQQQATLNAEALGWETGTQHEVAVQVTSESGNPSKWSTPVTITIADAISCDITQTSLEYDNVPVNPEEYTGNPITFDTGEQEKEVASLNVSLLPKQDGTPSQDSTVYNEPYLSKTSPSFNSEYDKLVGGSVAWNQLINDANTYVGTTRGLTASLTDHKYKLVGTVNQAGSYMLDTVSMFGGHKYLIIAPTFVPDQPTLRVYNATAGTVLNTGNTDARIFSVTTSESYMIYFLASTINVSVDIEYYPQLYDLTQMFGSTIADYVYTLEQGTAGAGVAWLKSYGFFTEDYYPYNTGELISTKPTAHVTSETYPLAGVELRGIPKLDNGNLYYDGDTYESSGTVTRKYGIRAYQSGDESDSTVITDLTNTVYPLATPTTETVTGFTSPQAVGSTESYTDNRAVPIPVGHESRYADIYPITGRTQTDVVDRGVNLADPSIFSAEEPSWSTSQYWIGTTDNGDGTFTATRPIGWGGYGMVYAGTYKAGTYTVSTRVTELSNIRGAMQLYFKRKQTWDNIQSGVIDNITTVGRYSITKTITEECDLWLVCAPYTDNGKDVTFGDIQVELGSTMTDYTEYHGHTKTVTLPHTVYGADVDVTGGNGVENLKLIDASTLGWNYDASGKRWQVIVTDIYNYPSRNAILWSDRYVADTTATTGDEGKMFTVGKGVYIYSTDGTNAPTGQLVYPLATPTDLQTTPTDVELLTGVNNISADGDMELTIVDMIESGYYLKELPLTATVTGAGPGGQTSLRIERAESYELDGPDDKTRNGFEGAAAAEVQQAGENQIEVDLADLIGRLDDGARYRIRASVQDAAGQSAEAEPVEFTVLWNKQASIPGGTAEIENGVAIITPEAPENANEGDTVDIYRLSADRPELIVKGGTFGTQYVDPYPTLNEFGGYRIVTVTEYGDYITEANEMAWTDIRTNNDSLFQYIDFDGNQLELKYNAELSNTWTKQFTATRYLGGSIRGDWLEGTQQEANVNGIVLRDIDQDTYKMLRALGDFSGICHVRTTDGSNFTANINVQSGSTYNSPGHPESVTLTITRVDNPRADGMTLAEWQTQESE